MIRCDGLVFAYPDGTRALNGVDLEIATGERVAIVGQNGSGKSTLVRHWNGLLRPTAGTVTVDGRPAADRRGAELGRGGGPALPDPHRPNFARPSPPGVAVRPRKIRPPGPAPRAPGAAAPPAAGP